MLAERPPLTPRQEMLLARLDAFPTWALREALRRCEEKVGR
jgi:hypothetical protein